MGLIPPWNCHFSKFPSFIRTSNTEEARPPYLLGIPPLYKLKSCTMSALKLVKKPNKWEVLNKGTPSSKIKFWSTLPPRTLKPEAPSPTVETPGSNMMLRITSASPIKLGSFFSVFDDIFSTPMMVLLTLASDFSSEMTTSSKICSDFSR